jgi:hypothetical protein
MANDGAIWGGHRHNISQCLLKVNRYIRETELDIRGDGNKE